MTTLVLSILDGSSSFLHIIRTATRGDQKVRGKVLLHHIAFIDCNENLQIETTIHSNLTEIEI